MEKINPRRLCLPRLRFVYFELGTDCERGRGNFSRDSLRFSGRAEVGKFFANSDERRAFVEGKSELLLKVFGTWLESVLVYCLLIEVEDVYERV